MTTSSYYQICTTNPINLSHKTQTKMFNSIKINDIVLNTETKESFEKLPEVILIEVSEIVDDDKFCFKYDDKVFSKVIGLIAKNMIEFLDNKMFINFAFEEFMRVNNTNQVSIYLKDAENGELIKIDELKIYINYNLL